VLCEVHWLLASLLGKNGWNISQAAVLASLAALRMQLLGT
jgi:hypothetical protein